MTILGFSGNFYRGTHDASCVVLKNGKVVSYVEEERFLRIKHAVAYVPEKAFNYSLSKNNLKLNNLTLAFPQTTWKDFPRRIKQFFFFKYNVQPKKILYFGHHLSHAASSYFSSGFKSSAIMTADYSGDGIGTGFYRGAGQRIFKITEIPSSNSLGTLYSAFTQYLGFERNLDEYKVMGLASFGRPKYNLDKFIQTSGLQYNVNKKFINSDLFLSFPHFLSNQQPLFSDEFDKVLGPHRIKSQELKTVHKDIAASVQKKLEETVLKLIDKLIKETKEENLCVAGGVFLNCTLNGIIQRSGLVKNLYVPPVAGDNGVALGAGYLAAIEVGDKVKPISHPFLGSSYTNAQIEAILKRSKLKYLKAKNIEKEIAKKLSKGQIIAHFNGAMEVGARALGNRSILADPRDPLMKDKINKLVKFREEFRPFAPAVLSEKADLFFENIKKSPFMTSSFIVKPKARKLIPATTHIDGTARVQTVEKKFNNRFWKIIKEFGSITGIPVVLNTSLNRNFEPIVESPDQAIAVFAATGIDAVVLGDFIIEKKQ